MYIFPTIWHFRREMEKAKKSLREIALDIMPQVANFSFWLRGQNVESPYRGNVLYPRKCSLSFEKSRRRRHSICGKMDAQKLLNVPLFPAPAPAGAPLSAVRLEAQRNAGRPQGREWLRAFLRTGWVFPLLKEAERYASKGNRMQVYALQMLVEAFGCSSGDTETAQGVRKRLPSSRPASASFLRANVLPLNIFGMQGANGQT